MTLTEIERVFSVGFEIVEKDCGVGAILVLPWGGPQKL